MDAAELIVALEKTASELEALASMPEKPADSATDYISGLLDSVGRK